jgi:hypothetical protein
MKIEKPRLAGLFFLFSPAISPLKNSFVVEVIEGRKRRRWKNKPSAVDRVFQLATGGDRPDGGGFSA